MQLQGIAGAMTALVVPEAPCADVNPTAYASYLCAYKACASDRYACREQFLQVMQSAGVSGARAFGGIVGAGVAAADVIGGSIPGLAEQVFTSATAAAECVQDSGECVERGKNYWKNKKRKARDARKAAGTSVPASGSAGVASEAGTVHTVDTRTGVEIEAAQTLAARRVAENKLKILEAKAAAKLVEHRLRALNDKERTLVIDRLAAARLEEKINTSKKKSQDSFKGCDSPIESVGSALSAHEFAFKQQVRKIEAQKIENKYKDEQLRKFYQYASPDVRQMVAEIPEPYIPTDEEMEAEDLDQSPEPTDEEMEAETARYFS